MAMTDTDWRKILPNPYSILVVDLICNMISNIETYMLF